MNDLQRETIKELQKILPQSHFVNIKVRIDGEWREYEADFLKEILAGQVEPEVIVKLADEGRIIVNNIMPTKLGAEPLKTKKVTREEIKKEYGDSKFSE